ncbi:hypothetical protein D3C85_1273720 [compost metagenome]
MIEKPALSGTSNTACRIWSEPLAADLAVPRVMRQYWLTSWPCGPFQALKSVGCCKYRPMGLVSDSRLFTAVVLAMKPMCGSELR